jgi:predicted regulator of Ras-like GTPase activity (Roadblock/LC7/MglB family)
MTQFPDRRVPPTDRRLDWYLTEFARSTPGVTHALVVSGDGLQLSSTDRLDAGLADQLAAVTSGLVSLSRSVARTFQAEPMHQTIIEMAGGYLFVTPVSNASALAVLTTPQCDIGMIGYEMTLLAERARHALTPAPRPNQSPTRR